MSELDIQHQPKVERPHHLEHSREYGKRVIQIGKLRLEVQPLMVDYACPKNGCNIRAQLDAYNGVPVCPMDRVQLMPISVAHDAMLKAPEHMKRVSAESKANRQRMG